MSAAFAGTVVHPAAASAPELSEARLPRAVEAIGEHFEVREYIDGRRTTEKLFDVRGVATPYRHYTILTEYLIQRSRFRGGNVLATEAESAAELPPLNELFGQPDNITHSLEQSLPFLGRLDLGFSQLVGPKREITAAELQGRARRFSDRRGVRQILNGRQVEVEEIREVDADATGDDPGSLVEVRYHEIKETESEGVERPDGIRKKFGQKHDHAIIEAQEIVESMNVGIAVPEGVAEELAWPTGQMQPLGLAIAEKDPLAVPDGIAESLSLNEQLTQPLAVVTGLLVRAGNEAVVKLEIPELILDPVSQPIGHGGARAVSVQHSVTAELLSGQPEVNTVTGPQAATTSYAHEEQLGVQQPETREQKSPVSHQEHVTALAGATSAPEALSALHTNSWKAGDVTTGNTSEAVEDAHVPDPVAQEVFTRTSEKYYADPRLDDELENRGLDDRERNVRGLEPHNFEHGDLEHRDPEHYEVDHSELKDSELKKGGITQSGPENSAAHPAAGGLFLGDNVPANPLNDLGSGGTGWKDLLHAQRLELLDVIFRNNAAPKDDDVRRLLLLQKLEDIGEQGHVGSGENTQSDAVDVFLNRRTHNHLRGLVESGIDDLHSGITQGAGDDLRSPIMAIEPGLGDENTDWG